MKCIGCKKEYKDEVGNEYCEECTNKNNTLIHNYREFMNDIKSKVDGCATDDLRTFIYLADSAILATNEFERANILGSDEIIYEFNFYDISKALEDYTKLLYESIASLAYTDKVAKITSKILYLGRIKIDFEKYAYEIEDTIRTLKHKKAVLAEDEFKLIAKLYDKQVEQSKAILKQMEECSVMDLDKFFTLCEKYNESANIETEISLRIPNEYTGDESLAVWFKEDYHGIIIKRLTMYLKQIDSKANAIDLNTTVKVYIDTMKYFINLSHKHPDMINEINKAFNKVFKYYLFVYIENDLDGMFVEYCKDYIKDGVMNSKNLTPDIALINYNKIKYLYASKYIKKADYERLKKDILINIG